MISLKRPRQEEVFTSSKNTCGRKHHTHTHFEGYVRIQPPKRTYSDKWHPGGPTGYSLGNIPLLEGLLQGVGLGEHRLKLLPDIPWGHGCMNVHFVEGGGDLGSEDAMQQVGCVLGRGRGEGRGEGEGEGRRVNQ